MHMYSLAIAALLAPTLVPVATAFAQPSDEPVVLMTLDDVEREKAEKAARDAEIARSKAECEAQDRKFCFGVPFSLQSERENDSDLKAISFGRAPPVSSGPPRAAQVDQDTDPACKLEQARRDHEYVSGEGPICRDLRLGREAGEDGTQYRVPKAKKDSAAADRESKCRTLADGSFQCGWQKATTQTCETQGDGTEACTTSTSAGVTIGRDD